MTPEALVPSAARAQAIYGLTVTPVAAVRVSLAGITLDYAGITVGGGVEITTHSSLVVIGDTIWLLP
jgi:hypothetical protein